MKILSLVQTSRARRPQVHSSQAHNSSGMIRSKVAPSECLVRWGLLPLTLLGLLNSGCGNTLYLVQVNRAESSFEEAQALGAEELAPYQYYSAKARLEEARRQAAQAEYGPASDLADEAYDYSVKAINASKAQRKAGGPQ
jgi:hypothetical protein